MAFQLQEKDGRVENELNTRKTRRNKRTWQNYENKSKLIKQYCQSQMTS